MARLEDFVPDVPYDQTDSAPSAIASAADGIAGVVVTPLIPRRDGRGRLAELLALSPDHEPIVHVYQVHAAPGSIRAWVHHSLQHDRLAFTDGAFRIALVDLREDGPTFGLVQVVDAGADRPLRLRIPPFVAHGVKNVGTEEASFVNMPTRAWDPARPDKARLPYDHPGIPYRFV